MPWAENRCNVNILAIETSGWQGSLAAWQAGDSGELLHEVCLPEGTRSAQSLAPALKQLLDEVGWRASEIDAVAVALGPGSFTGLRVGVTAAKMLAFVAGCGVIGVSTLRVLADQAGLEDGPVWAAMDAQRGELFASRFERPADNPPVELISIETFLSKLQPGDRVTGPVTGKLTLPADVTASPEETWQPLSSTVAQLAAPKALAGEFITPEELLPKYHRLSAAEEKRLRASG